MDEIRGNQERLNWEEVMLYSNEASRWSFNGVFWELCVRVKRGYEMKIESQNFEKCENESWSPEEWMNDCIYRC